MSIKKLWVLAIVLQVAVFWFYSCTKTESISIPPRPVESEIFYHVFLRSFYDSNGDGHGDLKGVEEKLDYLQELGVTAILLTPLYDSPFYHNYFPIDFEAIDSDYGTKQDYFDLLEAMHKRGMKLFMDMEIHYVTFEHKWFRDSFQNPASPYSEFIIYNGPNNTQPESIIFNLDTVFTWDERQVLVATTDMHNKGVRDYHYNLFKYWMDPNGDGDFGDGIDGYRIDHIMDDLDWKGIQTELLTKFWKPLFVELRELNPNIVIMGEQGEWDYGTKYFEKGEVDLVFAFPLHFAITKFDKKEIIGKADTTYALTPKGKSQMVYVENHDLNRFATVVEGDAGKIRVGAAFNILMKGVPIIYYGQELGMTGAKKQYGMTAANDIPIREAFEWYRAVEGEGMALWYKGDFPWWQETNLKDNDGISLEEQKDASSSLWSFYKQLIKIRKKNSAIQTGQLQFIPNGNEQVVSFLRWDESQNIAVIVNLNKAAESVTLDFSNLAQIKRTRMHDLLNGQETPSDEILNKKLSINLSEHEIKILRFE